jgi:chromosome segregation ATPase
MSNEDITFMQNDVADMKRDLDSARSDIRELEQHNTFQNNCLNELQRRAQTLEDEMLSTGNMLRALESTCKGQLLTLDQMWKALNQAHHLIAAVNEKNKNLANNLQEQEQYLREFGENGVRRGEQLKEIAEISNGWFTQLNELINWAQTQGFQGD